jgi:hypothetical protein
MKGEKVGLHPEILGQGIHTSEGDRFEADGQTMCECGCGEIIPRGCTLVLRENGDKIALDHVPYDE